MHVYGLIGYPLGHSFSAKYHNEYFAEKHIDACYRNFEIKDISELPGLIKSTPGLKGFNVTAPYKQTVIPYLDELSPEAQEIGAVNTVKILSDGRLIGYNTDVYGFTEALKPFLEEREYDKALILGTGGASRAIEYALKSLGIKTVKVTRGKGDGMISYSDLNSDIMVDHRLIVNCTPLGTHPVVLAAPDIKYKDLTERHLCFDLVYNPEITLFMLFSRNNGAKVTNGLRMLHLQADRAREIWLDHK